MRMEERQKKRNAEKKRQDGRVGKREKGMGDNGKVMEKEHDIQRSKVGVISKNSAANNGI